MAGLISRRYFLMGTAATLAGCAAGGGARPGGAPGPGAARVARTDKLNVACIGCGGQGAADVRGVSTENIVALCDVDWARAKQVFDRFPDVPKYRDYREMLDNEGDRIDAVTVAIPDHAHTAAAMQAMKLGKHVYVEKPMARTVHETRSLTAAAKQHGVITQMGNQGHSLPGWRQMVEMMEMEIIGPVREVHSWTNRPRWPQGIGRPAETPPVPATLDWDLWIGPAPMRPYHRAYCPRDWRGWWDFGSCALGDMGCHILDAPYNALKLGAPAALSSEHSGVNDETGPLWSIITYEFPARGSMPPVTLTWYDGGKQPARPAVLPDNHPMSDNDGGGTIFMGENGIIICGTYGTNPQIYPVPLQAEYEARAGDRPQGESHHQNFIAAVKEGKPANSDFSYAGPFNEMVMLGNVALRAGQRITWDAANMRVPNLPEADQFLQQPYRAGWSL
jgi:predicted dehydrogenase